MNKILTRGLGSTRDIPNSCGPVVNGYGNSAPAFVIDAFRRPSLRLGGSGTKRRQLHELDEVIIWAKLVQINDTSDVPVIKGTVKVSKKRGIATVLAEHVSSRVRASWETIKVNASRIK